LCSFDMGRFRLAGRNDSQETQENKKSHCCATVSVIASFRRLSPNSFNVSVA
jgi:hypothetical protein